MMLLKSPAMQLSAPAPTNGSGEKVLPSSKVRMPPIIISIGRQLVWRVTRCG